MRVLWTSNMLFPEAAAAIGQPESVFGGWMTSLADDVVHSGVELGVASLYGGKALKSVRTEKASYYLVPGSLRSKYYYSAALKRYWKEILSDFKPDLIHIHGSEYAFPLSLVEVAGGIPSLVSIQGLISVDVRFYMAQMRHRDAFASHTLADTIHLSGIFEGWMSYKLRERMEVRLLNSVRNVIGRTEWDYANALEINRALTYYRCNESLRDPFYSTQWSLSRMERHSVFTSQATYPIKGLHLLLEAVALLRAKYPDIKLYVAGPNIVGSDAAPGRAGYGKYIRGLIKILGLEDTVRFTGLLTAQGMAERMANVNVFVLPSAIENSPNSLGEAQLVGTPCVASYVGGVPSMAEDGRDALLYDYREPAVLATKIASVFEDDGLAVRLSQNGGKSAAERHDRGKNLGDLLSIYGAVCGE